MILFENKGYQTNSLFPNEDWTGEAKFIIEDNLEIAEKVKQLYPDYEFVMNNGKLVDITPAEKPPEPEPTDEEKQSAYNALSVQHIHEKYSYDDENKVLREYLSYPDVSSYKVEFEAYNAYVDACKRKAYKEVYGEDKSL